MLKEIKSIIIDTLSDKPVNRNDLLNAIRQHGHKCSLRTLRLIISEMNHTGNLISRTTEGYKFITTQPQMDKMERDFRSKAVSMLAEISVMKRTFAKAKQKLIQQELF